jgi:hypothetical protein
MKILMTVIALISTVNVFASTDYRCSAIKIRRGIWNTGILVSLPKSISTEQEAKSDYIDFGSHRVSPTLKLDNVKLMAEVECKAESNCSFHGRLDKYATASDGVFGLVADYQENTINGKNVADFIIDDNNIIRVKCE